MRLVPAFPTEALGRIKQPGNKNKELMQKAGIFLPCSVVLSRADIPLGL